MSKQCNISKQDKFLNEYDIVELLDKDSSDEENISSINTTRNINLKEVCNSEMCRLLIMMN